MSAAACPSIPPVVVEEAPATARQRNVTAQAETTTMGTVMATITLQEGRLKLWHLRDTTLTHTHTPIAILEGGLSPDPTLVSTLLFSHLTHVRNACPLATVGRCIVLPQI